MKINEIIPDSDPQMPRDVNCFELRNGALAEGIPAEFFTFHDHEGAKDTRPVTDGVFATRADDRPLRFRGRIMSGTFSQSASSSVFPGVQMVSGVLRKPEEPRGYANACSLGPETYVLHFGCAEHRQFPFKEIFVLRADIIADAPFTVDMAAEIQVGASLVVAPFECLGRRFLATLSPEELAEIIRKLKDARSSFMREEVRFFCPNTKRQISKERRDFPHDDSPHSIDGRIGARYAAGFFSSLDKSVAQIFGVPH